MMRVIVKKLQGGECTVEVLPTTLVSEMKKDIARQLGTPPEDQKLLLRGRTLADEMPIQSYALIKDGTKLNLVVKKPEGLYEVSIKYFKDIGMPDSEAVAAAGRLLVILEEKFSRLSWDDINTLAADCIRSEEEDLAAAMAVNGHGTHE